MATLPARLLEVEFDAGIWTDVTADFVELGTRRGRNRESGAFETGTLTFTLRNDARKYDPDNTAGPYYGKLRPNRRVRLRATYNAVTYAVFLGYIDRIAQVSEGPNAAAAAFTVSDFFKLLNRAELPTSSYAAEVATDTPTVWWRLGEPVDAPHFLDAIGAQHLPIFSPTGSVFGAASLIVREPDSAINFDGTTYGEATLDRGISTTAYSIEVWLRLPAVDGAAHSDDGSDSIYVQGDYESSSNFIRLAVYHRSLGTLGKLFFTDGTGVVDSTIRIDDDQVHHVVAVREAGGALKIYIDGVDRTSGASSGTWTPTRGRVRIARRVETPAGWDAVIGVLDELALYGSALSLARIQAHNTAGRTPWNGDLPGTRLGRIFDLAAVPAGDRNIDAGTTTLQATDLGGTALGYAQKVEETELGWLFVARDGKLRFIGRQAGITGAYLTSLATLVDDDSGAGLPYRAADADVDESIIVTRSTASREGSFAVTVWDAAAKAEFGWLDETHDGLLHADDAYSTYYAAWILNTHKAPSSRVGAVALELTKDPAALYPAILVLELGDQVLYKRKPQNVGAVISIPMRVEAISHETGPHYWRTRLQLTPFNLAAGVPVGVWNTSLWDQAVWGF